MSLSWSQKRRYHNKRIPFLERRTYSDDDERKPYYMQLLSRTTILYNLKHKKLLAKRSGGYLAVPVNIKNVIKTTECYTSYGSRTVSDSRIEKYVACVTNTGMNYQNMEQVHFDKNRYLAF